jgi:hypothetical protein
VYGSVISCKVGWVVGGGWCLLCLSGCLPACRACLLACLRACVLVVGTFYERWMVSGWRGGCRSGYLSVSASLFFRNTEAECHGADNYHPNMYQRRPGKKDIHKYCVVCHVPQHQNITVSRIQYVCKFHPQDK